MLPTTLDAIKAILRSDPTIADTDRTRLLTVIRKPEASPAPPPPKPLPPRLVRRSEAAQMLGRSLRSVDALAASGLLKRRLLPGRKRAAGFLESDVQALMGFGA